MRRNIINLSIASLTILIGVGLFAVNVYAEDGSQSENDATPSTSLTLTPVSQTMQISSNSTYDGSIKVTNDGSEPMKVEVYAAPYSYSYSGDEDVYKLGFSNENQFTQITRWTTIKDESGNYTARPTFKIPAGETKVIEYRISTPENIPAGGQYEVIFAQTASGNINASGIRTEASAGTVIYTRSTEGEIITTSEIRDMEIGQGVTQSDGTKNNNFYGTAKVKNTGNIDFYARGKLKVEPIIGFSSYETPEEESVISIIPESERVVTDQWEETPSFGLYKITWTIKAGEEETTIDKIVFLANPISIIITIIVLTIIIVCVIIGIRKRKARRSRLAV